MVPPVVDVPDSYQRNSRDVPSERLDPATDKALSLTAPSPMPDAVKAVPRTLSHLGLYSLAAEGARAMQQKSGPASAMIGKIPGVKKEEIENSGVAKAFPGNTPVTREQLADHFEKNRPNLQESQLEDEHEEYTMPGGTRYRTILLRAPDAEEYNKTHWAVYPDTISHLRLKDRDAGKTSHLEEVQSDRSQNGLDLGFREPSTDEILAAEKALRVAKTDHKVFVDKLHNERPALREALAAKAEPHRSALEGLREAARAAYVQRENPVSDSLMIRDRIRAGAQGRSREWRSDPLVVEADKRHADVERDSNAYVNKDQEEYALAEQPHRDALNLIQKESDAHLEASSRKITASRATLDALEKELKELRAKSDKGGVPPAPYVQDPNAILDLSMKRWMTEVARGNYSRAMWTPGGEQNKRYGLSEVMKDVTAAAFADGTYDIYATPKKGEAELALEGLTPEKLAATVGKELANKIIADAAERFNVGRKTYRGLDLELGGQGMRDHYDLHPKGDGKALGRVASSLKRIMKEHGGIDKFGTTTLEGRDGADVEAPHFDVTPEMRASILKNGFKEFSRGGAV